MIFIGPSHGLTHTEHTKAIVSVVIGEAYQRVWATSCRRSWEAYAARHGYDLIVLTEHLDPADAGRRSPAWQKCLILGQPWSPHYERIVWLDADIIANPDAPDAVADVPAHLVGATYVNDQLSLAEKHIFIEKCVRLQIPAERAGPVWGAVQNKVYRDSGIVTDCTEMVATGVMVLAPHHHRDLLLETYREEERSRSYEQAHLSLKILERGLLHALSPRWNWGVWDSLMIHHRERAGVPTPTQYFEDLVRAELDNAYFLHFYQVYFLLEALASRGWFPR